MSTPRSILAKYPPVVPASRRLLAASGYVLPVATYLSLAVAPGWWGDEARARLLFQFVVLEFVVAMLMCGVGRLVLSRGRGWQTTLGVHGVMLGAIGAVIVTFGATGSIELGALVAATTLPRLPEIHRSRHGNRLFAAAMLRSGALGMSWCLLVSALYLAGMAPGADDPPGRYSVAPPIEFVAIAIALYYTAQGYLAGHTRGLQRWTRFDGRS